LYEYPFVHDVIYFNKGHVQTKIIRKPNYGCCKIQERTENIRETVTTIIIGEKRNTSVERNNSRKKYEKSLRRMGQASGL